MTTPLHRVLRERLSVSDAEFGAMCDLSRMHVRDLRTGSKRPRLDTALRILSALKRLGVELAPEDLTRPTAKRKRKAA